MRLVKLLAVPALVPALAAGAAPAPAQEPVVRLDELPPLLVASGEATVEAAPDHAVVTLGATAQAADAATAQSQVSAVVQAVLGAVRELGVPAESVQTSTLTLYPVYAGQGPREEGEPRIVGYRASNTVRVGLDDLARIGPVIDAGVASGANQVEGIAFELRDDAEPRAEALRRAVASARAKAETLAQAAGVQLLALHRVEEGGLETSRPFLAQRAAFAEAATPVQPGTVQVRASATLTYRIGQPWPPAQDEGEGGGK